MSYQHNKEERIKACYHLFYEVKQFDASSNFLFYLGHNRVQITHDGIDEKDEVGKRFIYETAKNAFLESFLIHMCLFR